MSPDTAGDRSPWCAYQAHQGKTGRWIEALRSLRWVVHAEVATRRGELANAVDTSNAPKYLAGYASGVSIRNGRRLEIAGDKIASSTRTSTTMA